MNFNLSIINFWFPDDEYHSWWFIPKNNLDQIIYDKYYQQMVDTFDNFNIDDYLNCSTNKIISDIIILDQFSRNINRIVNNLNIYDYTTKAHLLSKIWIDKKYYLTAPIKYTVFALLPIRHIGDKNQIENMIGFLDEIKKNYPDINSNKIFQKFYFHSKRALE
jgi:uncharacterized protein (DUF924 family)